MVVGLFLCLLLLLNHDNGFQLRLAANVGDVARLKRILMAHPEALNSQEETFLSSSEINWTNPSLETRLKTFLIDRRNQANCAFNMRETSGATALHQAVSYGHSEIVQLLLANGANLEIKDRIGWTALFAASSYAQPDMAQSLISAGAQVNIRDNRGDTPLHVAALILPGYSEREVVSTLVENGAEVNAVNPNSGYTPLQWAVINGNEKVAAILLEHGADPTIKDHWGRTALDVALKSKRTNLVELLKPLLAEESVESNPELSRLVGQTVTLRGKFEIAGKVGPYIQRIGEPVYLVPPALFGWGPDYDDMQGKVVSITGTLHFKDFERVAVNEMVAQPSDYFYFDAKTAKVRLE